MSTLNPALLYITEIIEKIGPTLATIVAVYLAYIFARRKSSFEERNEGYKKIRIVTSNLIQIWQELSTIEYYIFSDNKHSDMLFVNSEITVNFFEIDVDKINELKRLLNTSKDEIKSINVKLFCMLENCYLEINQILDILESSLKLERNQKDLKKTLKNLFSNHVKELEFIIKETSGNLSNKERKEIKQLLSEHREELSKVNMEFEIPQFIIDLLNKHLPVKSSITSEELMFFYNDSTIRMLFSKILPSFRHLITFKTPMEFLRFMHLIFTDKSLSTGIDENFIIKIELSEEDNELFKNNMGFYKLICEVYKKFDTTIPFKFKRGLIELNQGKIDLKRELEISRQQLEIKKASA